MKPIIGIDPGNTHTAIVVTKGGKIAEAHYLTNPEAANWLQALTGGPPLLAKAREALRGAEVLANCLADAKALFARSPEAGARFLENNDNVLAMMDALLMLPPAPSEPVEVVCEMIASYGMPVGKEVFETCVFIGRLAAICPAMKFITRVQVKTAICHSARANDANVRQALIDRYGPPGTAKKPGPTHGIVKDMWAALAVATAYSDGAKLYTFGT
jgi:hypothetical protein